MKCKLVFLVVVVVLLYLGGCGGGGGAPGTGSNPDPVNPNPTNSAWKGIIASENGGEIWYITPDASKKVASGVVTGGEIRWSPDGDYLAYSSDKKAIFLNREGSAIGSSTSSIDTQFSWLPDSSGILTGVYYDGIYLVKPDGSSSRVYQTSDKTYSHCPIMSKDGQWVYWTYHYYGTLCSIKKAPASTFLSTGSGEKTVWNSFDTSQDEAVQIEPLENGKVIVAWGSGIWLIDPTAEKPLANQIMGAAKFVYASPNGKKVIVMSAYSIHIFSADTLAVLNTPALPDQGTLEAVCWSPDSASLAVMSNVGVYIWRFSDQKYQKVFTLTGSRTERESRSSISWTRER